MCGYRFSVFDSAYDMMVVDGISIGKTVVLLVVIRIIITIIIVVVAGIAVAIVIIIIVIWEIVYQDAYVCTIKIKWMLSDFNFVNFEFKFSEFSYMYDILDKKRWYINPKHINVS